jgi:hypothetical protein
LFNSSTLGLVPYTDLIPHMLLASVCCVCLRYYKLKKKKPSILGCSWNLNHSIFDSLLPSECELDFSVTTWILSFKMLHGFHTLKPACLICFLLIDLLMWWYVIIFAMLLLVCCNIFCFGVGGMVDITVSWCFLS